MDTQTPDGARAMQFSRDDSSPFTITRYSPESVRIAGVDHRGSLAVAGDGVIDDWRCATVERLDDAALAPLLARRPEVIVLAVGERVAFPDAAVMRAVQQAGVGLEVMNDGAAVRTFNVMLTEGRRVVLGLVRADAA